MQAINRIRTILDLPFLIKKITADLALQSAFLKERIRPILKDATQTNDGSLDEIDFHKINNYYGLAVPAILGEAFCALRGKGMSERERLASTCQGAMTGLFDDFFDKDKLSEIHIQQKIEGSSLHQKRSNEKLFDVFYGEALNNVPSIMAMKGSLTKVYEAQIQSKQQTQNIPLEKILEITLEKGGTSLQFYRTAFAHPYLQNEDALMYKAGSVMQLANDIFDIFKDINNNIYTLATTASSVSAIRTMFTNSLNDFYQSAASSGYTTKNIRRFCGILSMGIFTRCFVCLDHLEKSEITSGNKFMPRKYSRKQLICDMDTKKNMLRSAAYHIKTFPF